MLSFTAHDYPFPGDQAREIECHQSQSGSNSQRDKDNTPGCWAKLESRRKSVANTKYHADKGAALIQRILVIISCRAIIKETRRKTISGTTTRVATNGATPGITNCPNLGTIKN